MKKAWIETAAILVLATLVAASHASGQQQREAPGAANAGLRLIQVGTSERAFHVVATIIAGPTESVLWDAHYKLSDARRLAERIAATETHLTAIVLSHADHDHHFGAPAVLERFPDTPVYMTRTGLEDFAGRASKDLAAEQEHGDPEVPDRLVEPRLLPADKLLVDGHEIEIVSDLTGDVRAPASAAAWIPSLQMVLAGDLVFNGIHPWLGDADYTSRERWKASLRQLARMSPQRVVAGHKRDIEAPDSPDQIDFMIGYLDDYDELMRAAETPEALGAAMLERYPDLSLPILMGYGAKQWFQQ